MGLNKQKELRLAPGARFVNLGVLSLVLILGLTAVGHEVLHFKEEQSYLVALIVVFFVNFLGARYYVYRSHNGPIGKQLFLFLVSSLAFRATEYVCFVLLHTIAGLQYLLAVGMIVIVSFVVKFLFFGSFVFSTKTK